MSITAGAVAATLGAARGADAQVWRRIGERAKQAAERETMREVDRKVTGVVRCAFDDQECIRQAEREGKRVERVERGASTPAAATAAASAAGSSARPGEGVWANYDFVPGERVLFVDDFSRDNVGDFPRRLELVGGMMDVVEVGGQRYLRASGPYSAFNVRLGEQLPERFTIEFDIHVPSDQFWNRVYTEAPARGLIRSGYAGSYFHLTATAVGLEGSGPEVRKDVRFRLRDEKPAVPVRIMVDGDYTKMYIGEERVVNAPNAVILRGQAIQFVLAGSEQTPTLLRNLRIAAGGRKLYEALAADGRVATQGILFDTGSDRLRPESTPTLKEIGEMLRQHAGLRLRIEGHTDNVGSAEANQVLSGRRAAAVRQYLLTTYGVDAARLEAVGVGPARPVAPNSTPEGRQRNRRVELVRL
jgi:outer membrane protein OmpA-like peptidoglycan-associated protein